MSKKLSDFNRFQIEKKCWVLIKNTGDEQNIFLPLKNMNRKICTQQLFHNDKATRRWALDTTANYSEPKEIQSVPGSSTYQVPKKEIPADFDRKNYVRRVRVRKRSVSRRPNVLFFQNDPPEETDDRTTDMITSSLNESSPIAMKDVVPSDTQLEDMMEKVEIGNHRCSRAA